MKQNMNQLAKIGRKGMALLLALVMVLGVCMPVYATGDTTEPTVQETIAPETSEPTVETTAPEAEPVVETEPETTETQEPTVETTVEEETTVETTVETQPETSVPETTVPETTAPEETVPETTVSQEVEIQDQVVMAPAPEKSAYELAMEKLAAMAEEAKTLEADEDVLDAFCEDIYALANEIADLWDTNQITDAQYFDAENQAVAILTFLETTYNYVDGKIQTMEYDLGGKLQTSNKAGIKINLFDYGSLLADNAEGYTPSFHFNYPGTVGADSLYLDHPSGTADVDADALGNTLAERLPDAEGYPVVNINGDFKSLKNLFNDSLPYTTQKPYDESFISGDNTNYNVHRYEVADGSLFMESEEGFYYYDSRNNHAYYDFANKKMVVMDYAVTPGTENLDGRYVSMGHFLPFNGALDDTSIGYEAGTDYVQIAEEGVYLEGAPVATKDDDFHKTTNDLYQLNTYHNSDMAKRPNMWFGMSVEFDFFQPANGKIKNNDMIYEFSGDDFMWVYVDDVLLLDIFFNKVDDKIVNSSGMTSAGINFATGEVLVCKTDEPISGLWDMSKEERAQYVVVDTTIKALFEAAGKDTSDFVGETFDKYSKHNFKMFYLEYGTNTSNCYTRFNIEPLPEYGLTVSKDVVMDPNPDSQFDFDLEVKDQNKKPLTSVKYLTGDGKQGTLESSNGKYSFKLKDEEQITFDLPYGATYKVSEQARANYTTSVNGDQQGTIVGRMQVDYTNTLDVGKLVVDKTVSSEKGDLDAFLLSMEAYATGEVTNIVKPADIVLAIDQSASMYTPIGLTDNQTFASWLNPEGHNVQAYTAQQILAKLADPTTDAAGLTFADKVKQLGYIVAQGNEGNFAYCTNENHKKDADHQSNCNNVHGNTNGDKVVDYKDCIKALSDDNKNNNCCRRFSWFIIQYVEGDANPWKLYRVKQTNASHLNSQVPDWNTAHTEYVSRQGSDCIEIKDLTTTNVTFYLSQFGALYDSVVNFAYQLHNSGADHRVAIAGYAAEYYDQFQRNGSGLYIDGEYHLYSKDYYKNGVDSETAPAPRTYKTVISDDTFAQALVRISTEEGYASVMNSINAIQTDYYNTCQHVGFDMADRIYKNAPAVETDKEEVGRDQITILFTDGQPYDMGGYASSVTMQTEIREVIVEKAQTLKDQGIKVYTISTSTAGETKDITFLHNASSDNGVLPNPVYAMQVQGSSDLLGSFSQIVEDVGGTTVTLGVNTIMQDTIDPAFVIPMTDEQTAEWETKNGTADESDFLKSIGICAYTSDFTGTGWKDKSPFADAVYDMEIIEVDGKECYCVKVTGFDYAANYISTEGRNNDTFFGRKLILEIPVGAAESNHGGNVQRTNIYEKSGIYDPSEDPENPTVVERFPVPHVDTPVKLTLKKIVSGNMGDWSKDFTFNMKYVRMITHNENGAYPEENQSSANSNYSQAVNTEDFEESFTLRHDGVKEYADLYAGTTLEITEIPEQYTVTITRDGEDVTEEYLLKDNNGNVIGLTVVADADLEVVFTNNYEVTIDTGIVLDSLPYIVILAVVIAGAAFLFLRKRKVED